MENLTPNTRTTPDLGSAQTLPPIQAIFAARFAVKKFGHPHHSQIRKAVGTGLLTSLSQWNRTNPKPTISRSPQAERLQESDIFSTSLHPKQNKANPLYRPHIAQLSPKRLWIPTPNQYAISGLRHSNRTNPKPTISRKLHNSGQRASGSDSDSIRRLRPTAPEQNKPKPLRQPHIAQLRPKLLQIRLRLNTSSPAYGTRSEQTQTRPSEIQVKPKSIKKRIVTPPRVTRTEQTQVPPPAANYAT